MAADKLGQDLRLDDVPEPNPKVFVVTSDCTVNPPTPFLLRNYHGGAHEGTRNCFAWQAARATSAAQGLAHLQCLIAVLRPAHEPAHELLAQAHRPALNLTYVHLAVMVAVHTHRWLTKVALIHCAVLITTHTLSARNYSLCADRLQLTLMC